jgi:hypothetical protein
MVELGSYTCRQLTTADVVLQRDRYIPTIRAERRVSDAAAEKGAFHHRGRYEGQGGGRRPCRLPVGARRDGIVHSARQVGRRYPLAVEQPCIALPISTKLCYKEPVF